MSNSLPVDHASIHHDGSSRYVRNSSEKIGIGTQVEIRIRSSKKSDIKRVLLRTCPDGEQSLMEMQPVTDAVNPDLSWWVTNIQIGMPVTAYRFLLLNNDGVWWYNGSGLHQYIPTDAEDFRILADYSSPSWVRESVFYQIFPDRFADGDPDSNVKDGEFDYRGVKSRARRWGEPQSKWPDAMTEFYGGDILGVEQKLDYLIDLGVNAIYFNPIFSAYSNHRYDVIDYENVDVHLGGNKALISFRKAAAEKGFRFILDIVPNHCGSEHPWFKAAQADSSAPTAEFFTFHKHPEDYESWLGVRSLPKLNYRSRSLRDVIYAGKESIFRRWLRPPFSIDGWRVDVANMLARHGKDQMESEVWTGIRQAVKDENPDAYLLGENFFDASPQLQGDSLDASMNYSGFSKPLKFWLNHFGIGQHGVPQRVESQTRWPTPALVDSLQAGRAAIPWEIANQQFNLLGSHDTPRILDQINGDPALNKLAVTFLMTYVGVPCVYYGDEIGMRGSDSLESRNCMIWDESKWDADLRAFYQALINLRRTSVALIQGGFQVIQFDENSLSYLRDSDEEQIIVIGNRGPEEIADKSLVVSICGIPDGRVFEELFSRNKSVVKEGKFEIPIIPVGAQVWISK